MNPYDFKHPNYIAAIKKHESHIAKYKEHAVSFEDLPNFLKPVVDFTTECVSVDEVLQTLRKTKNGCVNWYEEKRDVEPGNKKAYDWIPKILKITEK